MNQYLLKISDGEVETYKLRSQGDWSECQFGGEGRWSIAEPKEQAQFWNALWNDERLSKDDEIGCLLLSEDKGFLSRLKAPEGKRTSPSSWRESELRRLFENQWRIFDKPVIDEKQQCISLGSRKYYYAGLPEATLILEPKKPKSPKPQITKLPDPDDKIEKKNERVVHPIRQEITSKQARQHDSMPNEANKADENNGSNSVDRLRQRKSESAKQNATSEDLGKVLKKLGRNVTDTVKN